jgi:hypothetical protein
MGLRPTFNNCACFQRVLSVPDLLFEWSKKTYLRVKHEPRGEQQVTGPNRVRIHGPSPGGDGVPMPLLVGLASPSSSSSPPSSSSFVIIIILLLS